MNESTRLRVAPEGCLPPRSAPYVDLPVADARQKLRMVARVPITISGALSGRSQRRTLTSWGGDRLTHPSVGLPVLAWRKIPEPRPGTIGSLLYPITARWR